MENKIEIPQTVIWFSYSTPEYLFPNMKALIFQDARTLKLIKTVFKIAKI